MQESNRRLNWRGLPVNPSSFCSCEIRDEEFSPEPLVLFVFNKAEVHTNKAGLQYAGKPAGAGLPGGGMSVDDMDTPESAALRELEAETGLTGLVNPVSLLEEQWLLILDKKSDALLQRVPFQKGRQPSVEIKHSEKALLNPFYLFNVKVNWEGSALRQFMLESRDELVARGVITREYVADYGLYINDVTDDELDRLEVKEKNEIAGFALIPISILHEMSRRRMYFLDPPANSIYVYRSHVERILSVLA